MGAILDIEAIHPPGHHGNHLSHAEVEFYLRYAVEKFT